MFEWAKLWPFRPSRARRDAARLVDTVSAMARRPGFFGEGRAADTLEGRFEVVALHASLAFMRLSRAPECAPLAQAFADALFRRLDAGLREAGVGDLSVPRKMRGLAAAFYGRLKAYDAALADADDAELTAALARNVLAPGAGEAAFAGRLAHWVRALAQSQAAHEPEALFAAEAWGEAPG